MKISSLQRQSGLNLVEVLVAALILSIGLLSMAGLQVASLRSVQNATQKQQASFIVHELLERMRSNRDAALAGDYGVQAACAASAPLNCSGIVTCSPTQTAAYDLYTLQCGGSDNNALYSGAQGKLIDSQFIVSCPAACSQGFRVSMSWHEMVTSKDSSAGGGTGNTAANMEIFNLSVDAVL